MSDYERHRGAIELVQNFQYELEASDLFEEM